MHVGTIDAADSAARIRWRSVFAAIAAISVVGTAMGLGAPLLSVILEERGHSASAIGLNTATAGLASIAAAPLATPLATRFGVVPTMLGMILLGALSIFGFFLAEPFWVWFPLRITLHVALTTLFILSEFWISTSAPPERRGFILGLYATVLSLGFALGPIVFSFVGSGGFLPFAIAMGLIALAAFPVWAARREAPHLTRGDTAEERSFVRYIWLVPAATAAVLVYGAVETGSYALFPVYGTRVGYELAEMAGLLAMIGLGNVLLQIPIGMLSDRVSDRRIILLACAAVGLIGMLTLMLVEGSWLLVAATLFVWGGVVAGLYTVGLAHLGSRLAGHELASANAAFVFCYGVGMLLGPQVIGLFMDLFGPRGFSLAMSLFFVGFIVLVTIRMRRRSAPG
ncbi:MFS transporter [Tianweitania sediminis]|uniref:MFS transporter n=1 Tax=Tianweitania sediminis TaxID=1502156 RepID=A0A8J7RLW5_9HYPH|nr:MFS transporter [Tianweitania sediminis]MBP0440786.1 MFS transporter [Tianweitania sediminis]